jgi:prepilin peptidase CpaA
VSPLPWSLLHASIALVAGMALFKFGMIGAGDAKFYAAAAAGIPLDKALTFLGWTSAAGLALLFAMVLARLVRPGSRKLSSLRGWSVPYGVAIFGGFALTLTAF